MDADAVAAPRPVPGQVERMLDAGCEPEFVVAYLAQRGTEPRAARTAVHAEVDRRRTAERTRALRRRALAVEATGATLVLLGAGVAWTAHRGGTAGSGPAVLLAVVGYAMAWRGLARWLAARRLARREVRRRRHLGTVPLEGGRGSAVDRI